jgi:hypothetical protein
MLQLVSILSTRFGEVLPSELAPHEELLVGAEVLVAANVELVGVAAGIHILLPVGHAVVSVCGGIANIRAARRVELLQSAEGNLAERAGGDAGAVAAAGVGIGETGKAVAAGRGGLNVLREVALHHQGAGNNL